MISNDIYKRLYQLLKRQLLLRLLNTVCAIYCIAKYRFLLPILLPYFNLSILSSSLTLSSRMYPFEYIQSYKVKESEIVFLLYYVK